MQSSQELFFEEFAVRFQIFFKEMVNFCEDFLQQQHSSQPKSFNQRRGQLGFGNFKTGATQSAHPRRKKEPVDPDAPRKPPSSFILYFQDKKSEFQAQNPTLSITEITKLIGKSWNGLSEEKQNFYKNKALTLKQTYEKDFEIYAKKKGIAIPLKRKPAAVKPKSKVQEQVIEDEPEENDIEIVEAGDEDEEEEEVEVEEEEEEEEVKEEEDEEEEEDDDEEKEEVKQQVKPASLKNSVKQEQIVKPSSKKNAISSQTAANIKEKKIKLVAQASDDEMKVKKKIKKQ